jgi:hypothetical protein
VSQLAAFGLTLAVELPWYGAGLVARRLVARARWWWAPVLGVAVNAVSHPLLWWWLAPHPSLARLAVAEAAVWLMEALLLWAAIRRELALLLVLSLAANASSLLIGLILS